MSRAQNIALLAASGLCLLLGLTLVGFHLYNHELEQEASAKSADIARLQQEIGRGEISRRVTQNIVNDLAPIAAQKSEVRTMLSRYGIDLPKE